MVFAVLVSLGLMLWPLIFLSKYDGLPSINDVTTDMTTRRHSSKSPSSVRRAPIRSAIPGPAFARKQLAAYPDIKPIEIDRSTDEVFELAVDAAKRLKMEVVHQEAPDISAGRAGLIEIADRTLILGFYDDVAIRVAGTEQHARVDVRSASRYGEHDLGRNADRVRVILKEIVTVMELTVPAARGEGAEEAKAVKEERPRSRRSKNRRRR